MGISPSFLLSLCVFVSMQAQTIQPDKREANRPGKVIPQGKVNNKKITAPARRRAMDIIDQLSQAAKDIEDEKTKIRARVLIADVLWDYNSDRSRKIFEEVFDATYSLLAELQKENKTSRLNYGSPEIQLRSLVLRIISRRDSSLAEKLLERAPEIKLFQEMNKQAPLSLEVARNIADTDPEKAGQIVENSLKNGICPMTGLVLDEIRYSNPAVADKLFLQALTAAQSDSNNIASNISALATYVFPSYGGLDLELMSRLRGAKQAPPALINRFLEFAYEMLIKRASEIKQNGIGNGDQQTQVQVVSEYQAVVKLLPYFNQYMPDKVAVVRAQIDYIGKDISKERIEAVTNPFSADRIENLLEKAKTAKSPGERDMLYTQAASYTNLKGDPDKGLLIASEIKDEERRSVIESIIRYQATLRALGKEDIDTAYHYARNITFIPQYAMAFNRMLGVLGKTKVKPISEEKKQRAMDLLDEAERCLIKAENGYDKAISMLRLAEAAINIDSSRAFDFMQYAVKALNNTDFNSEAAANKGGVERGPARLDTFNFDQTLTVLARVDADRALWLAQSLERKELNIFAQLSVCRGMLAGTPEVNSSLAESVEDKKANKPAKQKGAGGI